MNVVIIGANGKVGRLISQKMKASKQFQPTAFIRNEDQKAYFENLGIPVLIDSLENSEEHLSKVIEGFDAVVFSAGSGGSTGYDKTIEIDLYGAVKIIEASKKNHVKRFIMVGAAFSDVPEYWKQPGMKPYYIAKHLADKELMRSGLDYTVLRPVRLTDNEQAGKVKMTSNPFTLNEEIPREAVAETVLAVLDAPRVSQRIIEMSEGELSIQEALSQLE